MADKKSTIEIANDIVQSATALAVHTASDQLYMYDQDLGYYREVADREMGKLIRSYCVLNGIASQFSKTLTANVAHAIETDEKVVEVDNFNDYDNLINFSNGYIDINEKKEDEQAYTLNKHTDKKFFTSSAAIAYDPKNIKCPVFLDFIQSVFKNKGKDTGVDKDTINYIFQLGGYLLYPKNVIQKMFFFLGNGGNGKGILVNHVFQRLFPKELQSNVPLDIMANTSSADRLAVATSRVNFANENTKKEIDTEQLKNITGGDVVSFKRLYKRPLEVKPNCKVLVSTNQQPRLKDTSDGIKRRVEIITFPNKFVSKEDYSREIEPEEFGIYLGTNEEELSKKLKEEMPAIVNLFLKGLQELRENNWQLRETNNTKVSKQDWKEDSDNIGEWLIKTYRITPDAERVTNNLKTSKDIIEDWTLEQVALEGPNNNSYIPNPTYVNRRVREIFRTDPYKKNIQLGGGKRTTATGFYIKRRDEITLSSESSEEIAKEINGQMTL